MDAVPLTEGERLRRLINAPVAIGALPGASQPTAPPPPGVLGEFSRGFSGALGGTVQGLGQIAADLPGADQGNALQQYGQDVQNRNVSGIQNFQDIKDRPGAAFASGTGNAAGSVATMLGARALGTGITAAAPYAAPLGPIAVGAVGALGQLISWGGPALALFAQSYGGIRQQQIQDNPEAAGSLGAKTAGAVGGAASTAIEQLGGGQRLANILMREGKEGLAKAVGKEGVAQVAGATPGSVLRNIAESPILRTAVRSGIEETGEQILQSPIEQAAAFQNPLTPASLESTAFQATIAALGGGGIGAGFGAFTPHGKATVDPKNVSDDDRSEERRVGKECRL